MCIHIFNITYTIDSVLLWILYTYFIYYMLYTFNYKIHPELYYAVSRIK